MTKRPPPKKDGFDSDALWLSVRLGVAISLIAWCFHPALVVAQFEAMLVAAIASVYGLRSLLDFIDVLRLRATRRRDRDYWGLD